jgi:hypothetical protein
MQDAKKSLVVRAADDDDEENSGETNASRSVESPNSRPPPGRPETGRQNSAIVGNRVVCYPHTLELSGNSVETDEESAGAALNERQGTARNYQRGSRNPRPPDALAFWRQYSA